MAVLERLEAEGIQDLVETCGGLGVFATLATRRLSLRRHLIGDIDPQSVRYLQALFLPATVIQEDAYRLVQRWPMLGNTAIVVDYSKWTLYRYQRHSQSWESKVFHALTERIRPRILVFTDSARAKFHLQQSRYEGFFQCALPSLDAYLALYERFAPRYRVGMTDQFKTRGGGGTHVVLKRNDA